MSEEIKIHSIKKREASLEGALRKIQHYADAGAWRAHTHFFSQVLSRELEADERLREGMVEVYRQEIDKNSANFFEVRYGWPDITFDSYIVVAEHRSSPLYLALRSTDGEKLICDYLSLLAIPKAYVPTQNGKIDPTLFVLERDYCITVQDGRGLLSGADNAFARLARGERLMGEDYTISDSVLSEIEEKIRNEQHLPSIIKRFLRIFNF